MFIRGATSFEQFMDAAHCLGFKLYISTNVADKRRHVIDADLLVGPFHAVQNLAAFVRPCASLQDAVDIGAYFFAHDASDFDPLPL